MYTVITTLAIWQFKNSRSGGFWGWGHTMKPGAENRTRQFVTRADYEETPSGLQHMFSSRTSNTNRAKSRLHIAHYHTMW